MEQTIYRLTSRRYNIQGHFWSTKL